MVIFPLAPDQTIAQMWSNGARGGGDTECMQLAGRDGTELQLMTADISDND